MYSLVLMAALSTGTGAPDFHFPPVPGPYSGGPGYGCHGCGGCIGGCFGHGYGYYGTCDGGCWGVGHSWLNQGNVFPPVPPTPSKEEQDQIDKDKKEKDLKDRLDQAREKAHEDEMRKQVEEEARTKARKEFEDRKKQEMEEEERKRKEREKDKEPEKLKEPMKEKGAAESLRAILVVTLPADARLFIDNQPTRTTTGSRTFRTPELQSGEVYAYELRAEISVEGRTLAVTRRIRLKAGEEVRTTFDDPRTVTATQP